MTNQELSLRILKLVGGKENVAAATNCMTRLRVHLKDYGKADLEGLRGTEGVLQVIMTDHLHVVLGPGKARKVADCFKAEAGVTGALRTDNDWRENKAAAKAGQKQSPLQAALKSVGDIFVPLIPGVIAAGLCSGFATLITQLNPAYTQLGWLFILHQLLTLISTALMGSMTAWAGYRAAERFGATPILGGMLGTITTLPGIDAIARTLGLYNDAQPLDAILRAGRGGVLAVILGVLLMSRIEKWIRARMPDALDTVLSPVLILFAVAIPYILVIMPLTGLISKGLVAVVGAVSMAENVLIRIIAGYLAAFLFLPLVAMGMHHGLVALYTVQLETIGFVTLYPALAMAGAGQVGAAVAIWLKARRRGNHSLMRIIGGALPAGVMGVGEPLIYGVTLPLGRPFITAGLGAGFGGAFCMAMMVAATTWGPSGLLALPIMVAGGNSAVTQMLNYFIGLIIAYVMGFIITHYTLKEDMVAGSGEAREQGGTDDAHLIYAPMAGEAVALSEVPDPTFSQGVMGRGVAIKPSDGRVCSPADGRVETMFDTGHAVSLIADNGAELLIHVGLETVGLNGAPFKAHVQTGERVQRGQMLLEADLAAIEAAGLPTITPVVVCNSGDFETIDCKLGRVGHGDAVIELGKGGGAG